MSVIDLERSPNLLVRAMGAEERALLAQHFARVELVRDFMLVEANRPIERVFFPEAGIISVVATASGGARSEVGIFGREGLSGVSVLLGADRMPLDVFTQVDGGTALCIGVEALRAATAASRTLHTLLLRFCHCWLIQAAAGVAANAHQQIEGRLARWLLMCHDRIDGDDIPLTHEFMAMMIAAQRTGVTIALHVLEGDGLIRSRRGLVTILDRARLLRLAGASYGAAEAEYSRLIAPFGKGGAVAGQAGSRG